MVCRKCGSRCNGRLCRQCELDIQHGFEANSEPTDIGVPELEGDEDGDA